MGKSKNEAYIEAALEVCDAIEEISEECGDGELVAVLAARLMTGGDRGALKQVSERSLRVASDAKVADLAAEAAERAEGDEDDDEYEDDEDDDEYEDID